MSNKTEWIDLADDSRAQGGDEAVPGVSFRSPCGGWVVAVDDLRKPPRSRRWVVWDVRKGQRRQALLGVVHTTREMGFEAASRLMAGGMGARLVTGLRCVFKAHLDSLLLEVRGVLAAEVKEP